MESAFIFDVEDADADSWSAEVAVGATKPAEASRRIRAAGVHKKQIRNGGRPVRVVSAAEIPGFDGSESGVMRRRLDDGGWTPWVSVPAGTSLNWRVSGEAVVRSKGSGHR